MQGSGNSGGERTTAAWSSPGWPERASAWIDTRLAELGMGRTGPVERERVRPWGAVLRAETDSGRVWMKAPADATLFEIPLYALLAEVVPERILAPLAIDRERGWVLLPDGGLSLGEQLSGEAVTEPMAGALPRYAELQIALLPRAEEMLALGVADMRAALMPERLDEALVAVRGRGGADTTMLDRVEAARPSYVELCGRLADAPVGPSLDHNDLHAFNVLAGPDGDWAQARFYDWGDGVVAHPFSSMLALGYLPAASRADVERLRNIYLEPFGSFGSHAELVETLELACRVGKVARAHTWLRAMSAVRDGDEVPGHFASAPAEVLETLLEDDWVGSA